MQRSIWIGLTLMTTLFISGTTVGLIFQDGKPRKVKRVKRPVFKPKDWDGVYLENLFRDGLVGKRPEKLTPDQLAKQGTDAQSPDAPVQSSSDSGWSALISRSTIEDEVKSIQQQLGADITTPGKFKTDYAKVHHSFSLLSMLFGIIREYDDEVRWKKFGGEAQASFQRAAANSRVGTIQAYESCKRRSQELQDLVRGGNFAGTDKAPESLDWGQVVGHSPIMVQLETSYGELKQRTARKGEFAAQIADVLRHAELIAAMSQAVQLEGMEYAEEEGYVDYAKQMRDAAKAVVKGCRENDFEGASNAVNLIGQTCSNCHDEWR